MPDTKSPPDTANSVGKQDRSGWIVEVSLDVEWVHAVAPRANDAAGDYAYGGDLGRQGLRR
jgi:hypothetical protein